MNHAALNEALNGWTFFPQVASSIKKGDLVIEGLDTRKILKVVAVDRDDRGCVLVALNNDTITTWTTDKVFILVQERHDPIGPDLCGG